MGAQKFIFLLKNTYTICTSYAFVVYFSSFPVTSKSMHSSVISLFLDVLGCNNRILVSHHYLKQSFIEKLNPLYRMHFLQSSKSQTAKFKSSQEFHIHHYQCHETKYIIWTKSPSWNWGKFLDHAIPSSKIHRLVEIVRDPCGAEKVVKDLSRPQ